MHSSRLPGKNFTCNATKDSLEFSRLYSNVLDSLGSMNYNWERAWTRSKWDTSVPWKGQRLKEVVNPVQGAFSGGVVDECFSAGEEITELSLKIVQDPGFAENLGIIK